MMQPLQESAQEIPQSNVPAILVSKHALISGLQSGDFAQIALFEMIGTTFQTAMHEYITGVLKESDMPVAVVVLMERG